VKTTRRESGGGYGGAYVVVAELLHGVELLAESDDDARVVALFLGQFAHVARPLDVLDGRRQQPSHHRLAQSLHAAHRNAACVVVVVIRTRLLVQQLTKRNFAIQLK